VRLDSHARGALECAIDEPARDRRIHARHHKIVGGVREAGKAEYRRARDDQMLNDGREMRDFVEPSPVVVPRLAATRSPPAPAREIAGFDWWRPKFVACTTATV
jgi:hypothetical protein